MTQSKLITLEEFAQKTPSYLETIFSQANGYFGMRASWPVNLTTTAGTIVNGFFETAPIQYGESAYGYAKEHQTTVLLPDFRAITIQDEQRQSFNRIQQSDMQLNLANGQLTTRLVIANAENKQLELTLTSVAGQQETHYAAFVYHIKSINYSGPLRIEKQLKLPVREVKGDDPRQARDIQTITAKTRMIQANALETRVQTTQSGLSVRLAIRSDDIFTQSHAIEAGEELTLEAVGFVDFEEHLAFETVSAATIFADAAAFWSNFWAHSQVEIEGDDQLNRAIHYNMFQLVASAGRNGRTNVAAKGLSGIGYEGHYFWDTEMYLLPFFTYTNPEIAKKLLIYRYGILYEAKKRARELGVTSGALYAWRTINGKEASVYFPAGTAQYHIDGDIAYAVARYYQVTHDEAFMTK